MKTMRLGNTDQHVSAMCLGAMNFGSATPADVSYRLLDMYVDAGGSFIDTANIYAQWVPGFVGGESEILLGRWMKERGNRDSIFLATKVGGPMPGIEKGLRAAQIEAEIEKSLTRLQTDYVDLYYEHLDDRLTPFEESLAAFDRLIRDGKVRTIGASNLTSWRLEEALWTSRTRGFSAFCCLQQRHSYLRPKTGHPFGSPNAGTWFGVQVPTSDELFDVLRSRPVTLLAYSPTLSGMYGRDDRGIPDEYDGPDSDARLAALQQVVRETGASPNQIVLAWIMQTDPPAIPLIAASDDQHLAENLAAGDIQLTPGQLERLDEAGA